jgi:hypothetical protein
MPPDETTETTEATQSTETTETTQTLPDERAGNTPAQDWRDALGVTDKKLRDSLGKFTSGNAFVESHNHLAGRLKSAIFIPNEKSPEEEVVKFRKALGVPDKSDGYLAAIQSPEGQQYDESDLAVIEEFAEIALQHNVPAGAFGAFMQKLTERAGGLRESVVEEIESARDAAEDELAKEWGNDFDKNVQLATRAAKAHGGDRFVKFLNGTKVEGFGLLGDHPEVVRFLANIGSKSDEHDMVLQSTSTERASVQQRIDEIYEKYPVDSTGYKSKRVQEELAGLFAKLHGDKPVVGATR